MRIFRVVSPMGKTNSIFTTLKAAEEKVNRYKTVKLIICPEELEPTTLSTPISERYFVFYGNYHDAVNIRGVFNTLELAMKSAEECTTEYADVYDINGNQIY